MLVNKATLQNRIHLISCIFVITLECKPIFYDMILKLIIFLFALIRQYEGNITNT